VQSAIAPLDPIAGLAPKSHGTEVPRQSAYIEHGSEADVASAFSTLNGVCALDPAIGRTIVAVLIRRHCNRAALRSLAEPDETDHDHADPAGDPEEIQCGEQISLSRQRASQRTDRLQVAHSQTV
jgi:hypothetical protein